MDRPRITLTKEQLERAEIPLNHVLIRMVHNSEGAKSKGGVIVGFNVDTTYVEGDTSWVADLAECYGVVHKVPNALLFDPDDPLSMDWETDMELLVGDMVWFSIMESKNSPEILCERTLYKSIPFSDIYVAKRNGCAIDVSMLPDNISVSDFLKSWKKEGEPLLFQIEDNSTPIPITKLPPVIVPLNGYVLCEILHEAKLSDLDVLSEDKVDKTKGRVKFIGEPPKRYLREEYTHIEDIKVGDEVLFDHKGAYFLLERTKALAEFDGDNQYWVIPRRRIVLILNR